MNNIAISTDTNSGIMATEAEKYGIHVLPMPVIIDKQEYFEGKTITQVDFFEKLALGADVSTSQPAPADLTELWDELLKSYEYVIHIPMSSALSSSCETARALAMPYGGKVVVVDNIRISITLKQSVLDAVELVKRGKSATEIKDILENRATCCSIYLAVNTLELLKKSGRVTAAAAKLSAILSIKPVLQIQGGKLDSYNMNHGMKKAEASMLTAISNDMKNRFQGKRVKLMAAYSGDLEPALLWKKKIEEAFPSYSIEMDALPLSIDCHVGAGVKAIGCMEIIPELI